MANNVNWRPLRDCCSSVRLIMVVGDNSGIALTLYVVNIGIEFS